MASIRGNGWLGSGLSSASKEMGIASTREREIGLPSHMSGPPSGWRSPIMTAAMHFAERDVHMVVPRLLTENASSRGHFAYLVAASGRDVLVVRPRAPWSLSMVDHVRAPEAQ